MIMVQRPIWFQPREEDTPEGRKLVYRLKTPGFAILLKNHTGLRIVDQRRALERRFAPDIKAISLELDALMKKLGEADGGMIEAFNAKLVGSEPPDAAPATFDELDEAEPEPEKPKDADDAGDPEAK